MAMGRVEYDPSDGGANDPLELLLRAEGDDPEAEALSPWYEAGTHRRAPLGSWTSDDAQHDMLGASPAETWGWQHRFDFPEH